MFDLLPRFSWPAAIVLALIVALVFAFAWKFVLPAWGLRRDLSALLRELRPLKHPNLKTLAAKFSNDRELRHLWKKYEETLHFEEEPGRDRSEKPRSTIPASAIFTIETVVDARISTEFFKHLPGIFTGLGILGTFGGLILGLKNFRAVGDSDVVKDSLSALMQNVGDAFLVSATAIGLAMLSTVIERIAVSNLYNQVDELTRLLDGYFSSGVGEEYLGRLTRASEDSAAQAKILKDALVGDLERILTNLTERQIEDQRAGMRQLGEDLTKGVAGALAGPLKELTEGARVSAGDNGAAVTKLLTDVLVGFGQKLEDLFGTQIGGINALQQKTIDSLGAAVEKLNEMMSSVERAGAKSADAINERLLAALGNMETHQKAANESMAAFVDRMREAVDRSRTETDGKLQETLSRIGNAVEAQLAALKQQAENAGAAYARRDGESAARTDEMLRGFASRVDEVLGALRLQAEATAAAQVDRERRASSASEEGVARLAAAMDAQVAAMREQTERTRAADAQRDEAQAAKTAELLAAVGQRVDGVLGVLGANSNRVAEASEERERRAEAARAERDREAGERSEAALAKLASAVEAQLTAMREIGDRSVASAAGRDAQLAEQTATTLRALGASVEEMLGALRAHIDRTAQSQEERDRKASEASVNAVTALARVVEGLTAETKSAVGGMSAAVDAMRGATAGAVEGMRAGADTLRLAATDFAAAGGAVAGVFRDAEGMSHGLRESAGSVVTASAALRDVVADHGTARDALGEMVAQMRAIVENARLEGATANDVLGKVEAASRGLGHAQKQAEEYLAGVTEILAKSHETYSSSLKNSVQTQHQLFFSALNEAVSLLQGAIQELALAVQPNTTRAAHPMNEAAE